MATPSRAEPHREPFADQAVRLRWRTGLTPHEVAALLGLSERTVQRWEAGRELPGAASLRALIAFYLQRGAFAPGAEEDAAAACWEAVRRASPRPRPPFDYAWFRALRGARAPLSLPARRQDWGEAPDGARFYGRSQELATLTGWVRAEQAQRVAVLGIGGVGKTALAARLAHELAAEFDYLYWRSLRNAPPVAEWLAGAISLLSAQRAVLPAGVEARLELLRGLLRDRRALLVLDNLETVLEPGLPWPRYRAGYEGYGRVLEGLGERGHQATLLVTSRETPPEVTPAAGPRFTWQVLQLAGLGLAESRALLQPQALVGDVAAWAALVARYRGNALALQLVGETIAKGFTGRIAAFLAAGGAVPADIGRLLAGQLGRLSALERSVLFWLAVAREPLTFPEVARAQGREGRGAVLGAVEGLRGRSLLERGGQGATITLQPVVLEYATDQLVAVVVAEVERGQPARLASHALVQATAREYVRRSQERLIAQPLLEALVGALGSAPTVEQRLLALLDGWRGRAWAEQGYGPGNVVNLLRLLRGHLRGLDLSHLAIRQAYLPDVTMHDTSLAGAHLAETVLSEAFSFVAAVALSADGAWLAVGTATGTIWLWRVPGRSLQTVLHGHTGGVPCVALSADGTLLASGSYDGTVRLWDSATGRLRATLEGHSSVRTVALSADGELVASGRHDGTCELWETARGHRRASLQGHAGGALLVALSGDGALLASAGSDGLVRLWDSASGQPRATLPGHSGGVVSLAVSEDAQTVASAGHDGTLRVWEARGGHLLTVLRAQSGWFHAIALSRDGGLVATASPDGLVRLWAARGGQLLASLQGHRGVVFGVAMSGDGGLLASMGHDGTVRLWETATRSPLATLQGYMSAIQGVALSADGGLVASASMDGTVRLWDSARGTLLVSLQGHSGAAMAVALSGDGQVTASASYDGTVRLWDSAQRRPRAVLQGPSGILHDVALSADGRLAAAGGEDEAVWLWEVGSGQLLQTLRGHQGHVHGVAFSGDGRLLASGGEDGTVRLWEVGSGQLLQTLWVHTGVVIGVALSRDGRLLASGGDDGLVRLWDTVSGEALTILRGHTATVRRVACDAAAALLASASEDGTVRLWDAASGQPLATLQGHTGVVWGVALSADGGLLASGGNDGTVRLWDTVRGVAQSILRPERLYERLDITGLTGVTEAQRHALLAHGAVQQTSAPKSRPDGVIAWQSKPAFRPL